MSVASQLINPPTYRYPHIRSGYEWSSYGLDNLAIEKFYDFRFAKADSTLSIYAGGPNDSEQEKTKYIEGVFSGAVFNQPYWEEGDVYDFSRMVTDIRLFISHDGAYLLEQHRKLRVENNQLAIFVEIPDRDIFSKQVLLVKAGENAKKYSESVFRHYMDMEYFTLTEKQVKQLISSIESGKSLWDQVISFSLKPVDYLVDISIDILSSLVEFFGNTLRIDEKRWNSEAENYTIEAIENEIADFINNRISLINSWLEGNPNMPGIIQKIVGSINQLLSGILEFLNDISADIRNFWASLCGFWNGLVDLASGIFGLFKLLFQGLDRVQTFAKNKDYFKALALEYLDNLWQAILDINWVEWLMVGIHSAKKLIIFLVNDLPGIAKNKIAALQFNQTEISYYGGYMVFEILTFLFPPLKAGKLGKTEKIAAVMDDVAKGVSGAVSKGVVAGKIIAEDFFKQLDTFIKELKNGSQKLQKFFDDLLASLRKQADEAIEAFDAPKLFRLNGVDYRILKEGGKEVHVLQKNGKRIFEGSQKEVLEIAERLKGKTSKEAKEILEEIAENTRRLKNATKMWKDFKYTDFFMKPPRKPCFLEGTLVKTENGYTNIENLCVGERVWSYNIKSGQAELQPILQTYTGVAYEHVKLTTTRGQVINSTGTHRFYLQLTKKWKEASTLSLGDYLYDSLADENIHIRRIERIELETKTYNIEVAENHNYLVSRDNILTHNNSRYLKYNSTEEYVFEFYTLNDRISKIPQYAGITLQELDKRYVQHIEEAKRALQGIKPYNEWKLSTEISSVVLKDNAGKLVFASRVGGVKMTFFEARVIEQYIIRYYGGAFQQKGLGKLLNRNNAMSKSAFDKHKRKFNPCKFFV